MTHNKPAAVNLAQNSNEPAAKPKFSEVAPFTYAAISMLCTGLGLGIGKVITEATSGTQAVVGASLTAIFALAGSYVLKPPGTGFHPVTRIGMPIALGAVALALSLTAKEANQFSAEERKTTPTIDSGTVIGTREVTIADQYCGNRRGETKIVHNGQKMYAICPPN